MLLGEHGGGHEDGDLLAAHHGLERGANRHLRFAKAHVAADQAIHRALGFHVGLGRGDGGELIGRFLEEKGRLEFALPFVVRRKGEALGRLALGVDARAASRRSRRRLSPRSSWPWPICRRRARRAAGFLFPDADVARDEVALLERHVEPGVVGKGDRRALPRSCRRRAGCSSCPRSGRCRARGGRRNRLRSVR